MPGYKGSEDKALALEFLLLDLSELIPTNQEEISNLELCAILLALSRNN